MASSDIMGVLSSKDKEEMLAEFKKVDKDGNGKISAGEMKSVMMSWCQDAGEEETTSEMDLDLTIQTVFLMADEDGDKMINYEELVNFFINSKEPDEKSMMKALFKICDTDEDGKLSKKELTQLLKLLTDNQQEDKEASMTAKMMMTMADGDGDEKLSFEEFTQWMS